MRIRLLIISIVAIAMISTATALPELLDAFNMKYNTKGTRLDTCYLCHTLDKPQRSARDEICHIPGKPQKVDPTNLNPYGTSLKANLNIPVDQALAKIETIDSDGDRFTNIEEINNLTFPGDKNDFPRGNKKNILSTLLEFLNSK